MAPHVTPTTKLQIIGAFKLLRFLKSRPTPSGTCSNNDIFRLFSVSRTTGYRVLSEISASSFSDLTLTERLALDAETQQALEEEENARIAALLSTESREETRGRKRKLTERDVEVIEGWLDRNGGRGDVKWKDVPVAAGLGVIEGKNGVGVLSGVTVKRALSGWRERNRELDVEDWTRARGKGGLRGSEKARERWGRPKNGEASAQRSGEEVSNGGNGGGNGGGWANAQGTGAGQEREEEEEEGSESGSDDDVVETGAGPAQPQPGTATGSGSAPAPGTSTTPGTSSTPGYAGSTPNETETQEQQNAKKRRSASGPTGPDPRNLWNNRWEIEQAAIARREAEAKAAARAQLKINAAAAAKERYRLNRQRKRQQQKLEKQQQQERERLGREQQQAQQQAHQAQQGQTQQQNQPQPSYTGGQHSYAPGQQPQGQPQLPHPQPEHQYQQQHHHQQPQHPQQGQRPFTSMSFIPLPTYAQRSAAGSGSSGSGPSSAHQSFNNPSSTSNWNNGNPSGAHATGGEAEDIMMLGRLSGVIR